ncbi:HNH endonuclease [Ligilactobacillus agilis]|uniref:HNH endonuclease n=1 Tax=Ligilactobacillus agilis TaxID=1601 RepID=UPI003D805F08
MIAVNQNVFVKIAAEDERFIYVKNNPAYQSFLNGFFEYQEEVSTKAGRVKKSSNKAGSYRNFLIRLVIYYKEVYGTYPSSLENPTTVEGIKAFMKIPSFIEFNKAGHYYFSATIRGYIDYLDQLKLIDVNNVSEPHKIYLLHGPKKRSVTYINHEEMFVRNPRELLAAKHKADWKCCEDARHKTFTAQNDHRAYVEGHHLIPMRMQKDFEYTIDFADNIVPLCPNCHRKIHFAIKQDRNKMIEKFYFERIEAIETHGINISIDELEKCYS